MLICCQNDDHSLAFEPPRDGFFEELEGLSGPARFQFIEKTLYAYLACVLQKEKLLRPPIVSPDPAIAEGLRATLERVVEMPWDAQSLGTINGVLDPRDTIRICRERPHAIQAHIRTVERHLKGAIRSSSKGAVDEKMIPRKDPSGPAPSPAEMPRRTMDI